MRSRLVPLASLLTVAALGGPLASSGFAAGATTAPAKASVRLYLRDAFFVHGNAVTVPGRPMTFTGVVRPYVPGQWVTVRSFAGHHRIKSDRLRVKPSRNHRFGLFTERVASPATGILRVKVIHHRSSVMRGFRSRRAVAVLGTSAGFGSQGRFVELIAQRLNAAHIYLPQTGVYDQHMGLALDAYHRLLGWGVSQGLGGATVSALLNGLGHFRVRHPRDGKHIEGNLSKQLLAEMYGSHVYRIYPISSGKPSTPTVLGHFRVYRRTPGYLPDGMYYSSFFYGGYAIHGFDPAPDYAASHGCMRLPITDAISVFDWLKYGDVVDVYH
ncbi:MAG: L,D-transpeptidase family protein [Actinomycetota bacterium]|nr:L,D-transpeptidase family protein [Actinomycetota bacterium]